MTLLRKFHFGTLSNRGHRLEANEVSRSIQVLRIAKTYGLQAAAEFVLKHAPTLKYHSSHLQKSPASMPTEDTRRKHAHPNHGTDHDDNVSEGVRVPKVIAWVSKAERATWNSLMGAVGKAGDSHLALHLYHDKMGEMVRRACGIPLLVSVINAIGEHLKKTHKQQDQFQKSIGKKTRNEPTELSLGGKAALLQHALRLYNSHQPSNVESDGIEDRLGRRKDKDPEPQETSLLNVLMKVVGYSGSQSLWYRIVRGDPEGIALKWFPRGNDKMNRDEENLDGDGCRDIIVRDRRTATAAILAGHYLDIPAGDLLTIYRTAIDKHNGQPDSHLLLAILQAIRQRIKEDPSLQNVLIDFWRQKKYDFWQECPKPCLSALMEACCDMPELAVEVFEGVIWDKWITDTSQVDHLILAMVQSAYIAMGKPFKALSAYRTLQQLHKRQKTLKSFFDVRSVEMCMRACNAMNDYKAAQHHFAEAFVEPIGGPNLPHNTIARRSRMPVKNLRYTPSPPCITELIEAWKRMASIRQEALNTASDEDFGSAKKYIAMWSQLDETSFLSVKLAFLREWLKARHPNKTELINLVPRKMAVKSLAPQ